MRLSASGSFHFVAYILNFFASALRNGDDRREEDRNAVEGRANSEPCSIATRQGDAQKRQNEMHPSATVNEKAISLRCCMNTLTKMGRRTQTNLGLHQDQNFTLLNNLLKLVGSIPR